jgi:hypothetical protein
MEVRFRAKYPWALLPYKCTIDIRTAKADAEMYERSFRWLRRNRVEQLCWPWRLGQEVGWVVPSPVDVEMSPLEDVEGWCPMDEMENFGMATGHTEIWMREKNFLALKKTDWLRLYEVKFGSGWETMFVPNGEGTVEWHLGWALDIPSDYYLMILPAGELKELEVPVGILDPATVKRLSDDRGISIAIRPRKKIKLQRRQPIARIVLLPAESLKAKAEFQQYIDEAVSEA